MTRGIKAPADERFWQKVDKNPSGCWNWTASKRHGYGQFFPAGKPVQAHRWLYERLLGPVPAELDLDHLCRNRACVNPDHLEPVTRRVNTLRGEAVTAEHARKTHCVHGHEFTPENTLRRSGKPWWRKCRTCNTLYHRSLRATRRAGRPAPAA